ncbi:MAG: hypothetical protein R3E01_34460 [Pirellulaceae bacterium]
MNNPCPPSKRELSSRREFAACPDAPSAIWYPTHAVHTIEREDSIETKHYHYRLDFRQLLPTEEFDPQHYVVDTESE